MDDPPFWEENITGGELSFFEGKKENKKESPSMGRMEEKNTCGRNEDLDSKVGGIISLEEKSTSPKKSFIIR